MSKIIILLIVSFVVIVIALTQPSLEIIGILVNILLLFSPLLFLLPTPRTNRSPGFLSFMAVFLFVLTIPVGFYGVLFLAFASPQNIFSNIASPLWVILLIVVALKLLQMANKARSLVIVETGQTSKASHIAVLIGYAIGGFIVLAVISYLGLMTLGFLGITI